MAVLGIASVVRGVLQPVRRSGSGGSGLLWGSSWATQALSGLASDGRCTPASRAAHPAAAGHRRTLDQFLFSRQVQVGLLKSCLELLLMICRLPRQGCLLCVDVDSVSRKTSGRGRGFLRKRYSHAEMEVDVDIVVIAPCGHPFEKRSCIVRIDVVTIAVRKAIDRKLRLLDVRRLLEVDTCRLSAMFRYVYVSGFNA